jgi:hypothetical protein
LDESVAKSFMRRFDALHLDNVDACAENQSLI